MTAKQFFKGEAFKCLIALLCVLLVSGIFLTIMNSLLAVTEQERFERAINKIYGKNVKTEAVAVENYNDSATIDEAYKVKDDGNYLIKATGKGGFDNGTVTCWVVVNVTGGTVKGIDKVVIDSNKGQSYIGYINDKFLAGFSEYKGEYFNPNEGFIKTGATRSATAICNAVNASIDFVNAKFGNVAVDIYENFYLIEYINTKQTSHEIIDGSVVYHIKTKGHTMPSEFTIDVKVNSAGAITDYNIIANGSTSQSYIDKMLAGILDKTLFLGKNFAGIQAILNEGITYPGDGKDTLISTGATQSNYLCVYAAAFATKNYDKCLSAAEGDGEDTEGGQENE